MAIKVVDEGGDAGDKAADNLLNGHAIDDKVQNDGRNIDTADPSDSYMRSTRWKVAYMGMFYGAMSYVYRVNINIALPFMVRSAPTKMTSPLTPSAENVTYTHGSHSLNLSSSFETEDYNDRCPQIGTTLSESLGGEFSWNKQTQALVLSAFYYGYLFQFPFGWLAGKYGGKHIISVAMAISAVLTLLIPVLARWSVYAVIVDRILLGFCSGATMAAWIKVLSQWALPNERSRFSAMCWFGQVVGTILGFFTSGFLCAHGFDNGWGSVFYIHGIIGVVFVLLWLCLVFDAPEVHPRISSAELKLLTSLSRGTNTVWKTKLSVPWKEMLTYVPVWAIFISHIMECFVFYTVLSCLPLYMKEVLRFDIQSNGMFSSLPFISSGVGLAISGVLSDHILTKHLMSITATRKLAQVIGHLGTAVFIFVPGFLTCEQRMWVIACICLCMLFDAIGIGSGFTCSAVDIAPRYASIIFGMSNSFATIAGIVSPIIVGQLTTNDTAEEWQSVFFIATGAAILGSLVFGFFSSSDLAPWATERPTELEVYREPSGTFVIKDINIVDDRTNAV